MTAPKVVLVRLTVEEAAYLRTVLTSLPIDMFGNSASMRKIVKEIDSAIPNFAAQQNAEDAALPTPLKAGESAVWLVVLYGRGEHGDVELYVARVRGPRKVDATGRFREMSRVRAIVDNEAKHGRSGIRVHAVPAEGTEP